VKKQKNKGIKIEGQRIYLKILTEQNATPEYCAWLNDKIVNQYLETRKATIVGLKKYIKEKNNNPNCLFLGIFFKKKQIHIGNIKLEPIDFENSKATIGMLIGAKDFWGKGIGTEAIKLLVDYGFKNLNLKEINLGVISENKVAIKVYKKVGFKINSIEKEPIEHDNKLFDAIMMSIKNEKYAKQDLIKNFEL